ncbi:hypothetical protein ACIBH1_03500 [Nonomuraea sp. NPDC050663]|uniref:hypothetical protein n=1 Tax=Nonomuraea sp. NPDC050663 TaxID=3364370 RepID=UPI0037A86F18
MNAPAKLAATLTTALVAAGSLLLVAQPASADPDWPFPNDCDRKNYSKYMSWGWRQGRVDFTYDHTDNGINNYYRSTWRDTGEKVGNGWASCINIHQG